MYYIEALHKEGAGGDNLAVAWQGPGISQQVISPLRSLPCRGDDILSLAISFQENFLI